MCGIFFSLSSVGFIQPEARTAQLLHNRGPDSVRKHTFRVDYTRENVQGAEGSRFSLYFTYISTVLALRGDHIQAQPLVDPSSKSVLCWNGEAWKVSNQPVPGNDAQYVFELFLDAVAHPVTLTDPISSCLPLEWRQHTLTKLTKVINSISGPFSFVFYDGFGARIFYGRDCLGRRSLLTGWDNTGNLKISSLCDGTSFKHFEEVDTDGLHMIDVADFVKRSTTDHGPETALCCRPRIETIPWKAELELSLDVPHLINPVPSLNKSLPREVVASVHKPLFPFVEDLELRLRRSLELRVQNIPEPPRQDGSKLAVLFSGGLDCTILARLTHEILPINEPIDLLNVAFENPRVAAAAASASSKSPQAIMSIYEECPDRKTGRSSHAELQRVCPGRHWRFVGIDVPYAETLGHREEIKHLMRPHNTEMDLSIACALHFASRGQGLVTDSEDPAVVVPYATSARVLLSGLGADEIFAGYTRHATAFSRHGFQGLLDEIDVDVNRLGKRNLGRDDRVTSHWGREVRYPYLDEDFLGWALRLPIWEKCGFGFPRPRLINEFSTGICDSQDTGETTIPVLEPGKMVLRLMAWKLGMKNVSSEKKRAIQFGSRTAKMESGRSRGTHILP